MLYSEGGIALKHVAQEGYSNTEGVQDQVGCDPGQFDLLDGNPAHGRDLELDDL